MTCSTVHVPGFSMIDWWNKDDTRILWIHGDPGKGKTMMTMALIEEISRRLRTSVAEKGVLTYFFCQGTIDGLQRCHVQLNLYELASSNRNTAYSQHTIPDKWEGGLGQVEPYKIHLLQSMYGGRLLPHQDKPWSHQERRLQGFTSECANQRGLQTAVEHIWRRNRTVCWCCILLLGPRYKIAP
jgi:hypothetical protein